MSEAANEPDSTPDADVAGNPDPDLDRLESDLGDDGSGGDVAEQSQD